VQFHFTTKNCKIFFNISCLIQARFFANSRMSSPGPASPKPAQPKRKSVPRSALRTGASTRQPGRPHKRLPADVLQARTTVLMKKLQVLNAKKTLIAERLEAYEAESKLRETEQGKKEEA